jgi:hypothetical protein
VGCIDNPLVHPASSARIRAGNPVKEKPLKVLALFFVTALTAAILVGCSGDDDETVRIGALLPLTGSLQSYGEASRAAL